MTAVLSILMTTIWGATVHRYNSVGCAKECLGDRSYWDVRGEYGYRGPGVHSLLYWHHRRLQHGAIPTSGSLAS